MVVEALSVPIMPPVVENIANLGPTTTMNYIGSMTKSRQKGPLKKNYKDQQIIEPWEISHKQSEIVL